LRARLNPFVELAVGGDGTVVATIDGATVSAGEIGLKPLSTGAAKLVPELKSGLALDQLSAGEAASEEIERLIRRLAMQGLLEFALGHSREDDAVIIEPLIPGYWPRMPQLDDADLLALSRFAYVRRRGNELVIESPLADALIRICDAKIAAALVLLSSPQSLADLARREDFPGYELLALLVDCQILFKVDRARGDGLRTGEGDDSLILWDFHDLLFHTRSTQGRHANPLGSTCPYAGQIAPLPAVRPPWPGDKIALGDLAPAGEQDSAVTKVLHERLSTRVFDDQHPITLSEVARLLDAIARIRSKWDSTLHFGPSGPVVHFAKRPYPSGGASYPLELYLSVSKCDGLASGFYHYDADAHALVPIEVRQEEIDGLLLGASFATGASVSPQILITITARFGRVTWKYSSIAYALILKDVGVLMQTLYIMATDLGLGGCAIGTADINRFARMTGLAFHVEGPVGQFTIGRPTTSPAAGR
jgi:SagB-type dehydrogenase family enzyme